MPDKYRDQTDSGNARAASPTDVSDDFALPEKEGSASEFAGIALALLFLGLMATVIFLYASHRIGH